MAPGTAHSRSAKTARQALAVDEHRYDFRPEIWKSCLQGQQMEQRWFPGVHSNIGGGYGRDGLANLALGWIVEGAEGGELELDCDYLKYFLDKRRPYGSLYNSSTLGFRILDLLRRGDGKRKIGLPPEAHAELDVSVIERMNCDEAALSDGADPEGAITTLYRPKNVIAFLAAMSKAQRDAYLARIGAPPLPKDLGL